MTALDVPAKEANPVGWYLVVGRPIGAVVGTLTFFGAWIYSISAYGFLLGVTLGWIPSAICAVIAGALMTFLWGLIPVGLLIWALSQQRHAGTPPPPSAAPDFAGKSALPTNSTSPSATEQPAPAAAPVANPIPEVDLGQVKRGLTTFQGVYQPSEMGGAVNYAMGCYSKLTEQSAWGDWDFCATFDLVGQRVSDHMRQTNSAFAADYFVVNAVQARQLRAANQIKYDDQLNVDRIRAIGSVLDQAIALSTQIANQGPSPQQSLPRSRPAQPSFDCGSVTSVNLKLVCSTPTLVEADNQLANAYRTAMARAASPAVLRQSQQEWIMKRNRAPASVQILAGMYAQRTAQLWEFSRH